MNYVQHVGNRPQCCGYCKVLLGNGVGIVKELKQVRPSKRIHRAESEPAERSEVNLLCVLQEGQSRPGSSLMFCSSNCSAIYTSDLQNRSSGNKVRDQIIGY